VRGEEERGKWQCGEEGMREGEDENRYIRYPSPPFYFRRGTYGGVGYGIAKGYLFTLLSLSFLI